MKKRLILILFLSILFTFSVIAETQPPPGEGGGGDKEDFDSGDPSTWDEGNIDQVSNEDLVNNWDSLDSGMKDDLTSDQISYAVGQGEDLNNLDNFDSGALESALQDSFDAEVSVDSFDGGSLKGGRLSFGGSSLV